MAMQSLNKNECGKNDKPKKRHTKCALKTCKKKLSMVEREFVCRCGKCYCGEHRLPEDHSCSYNFEITEKERVVKTTDMRCVSEKVIKI